MSQVQQPQSAGSPVELPPAIPEAARKLRQIFQTENVRIWRYVDSQMVLFGCPTDGSDGHSEPPAFDERVAFLRDPQKLADFTSTIVVPVSDRHLPSGEFEHPIWDVPGYEQFNKNVRVDYLESILVSVPPGEELSLKHLVGVVCIDAKYSDYVNFAPERANVPKQADVKLILETVRIELRNYSNALFRNGFDNTASFLRAWTRTNIAEPSHSSRHSSLDRLLEAIDPGKATVSIYLRAYNSIGEKGEAEVPLAAGKGVYYEKLSHVESRLRATSPGHLAKSLFSAKAGWELASKSGAEAIDFASSEGQPRDGSKNVPLDAVLFPGSGGARKTFETYRRWFEASRQALEEIPASLRDDPAVEDDASFVGSHAELIESQGSFGVFPIRCMAETELKGRLVGLLCVAVENERNFFTWSRRLVIERFCRMVGRVHDACVAPVLPRVHRRTHRALIASPATLEKLLKDTGPLSPRQSGTVDRTCLAFVLSVDLRKSTDLMLKILPHRTQEYAQTLMTIFEELRDAVEEEYGVFDKFTGDGVLAFFPDFFGGTVLDAGYRLLQSAERCHEVFAQSYNRLWRYLTTVPSPGSPERDISGAVGLGIGIDYGRVRLVNVGDELTVVGAPVVYACRLCASAPAGTTFLNQRAFDLLHHQSYLDARRETLGLKHEAAPTVVYRVKLSPSNYTPNKWSLPSQNTAKEWPEDSLELQDTSPRCDQK